MTISLVIIALLSLTVLIGLTLLVVIFNRKKHPPLKSRSLEEGDKGTLTDHPKIEGSLDNTRLALPDSSPRPYTPYAIHPEIQRMINYLSTLRQVDQIRILRQFFSPRKQTPGILPVDRPPAIHPAINIALLNSHAAAGLSREEAPKLPIYRSLSPARLPTFSILSIQSSLMQLIANREYTHILRLIDYLKILSRADQIRILGRRYSSRERAQDPLPIIGQLDHYPQCAPAQEVKCRLEELCDTDKRLGSELIITLKKIDPNQIPTITSWLSYSLMGASAIDFIRMNDSNSHTSDLEKAQAVICTMLTELLQLFDQDQSIQRGSFTFTGRDGQVLKQIFDAIVRIEHDLPESQPVNDTTVPAASALAGTARGLAQLVTSNISPPKTTYNRSAPGASSHYRGCQQFGIDLPPGMLPMGKQHILFGFTQSGDFWLKLEEHGLGNIHDIALHGLDYIASRLSPPPEEPRYPSQTN